MSRSLEAEEVVQRQLEAFNSRDIESLISVYSDDAEMFEHPARLVAAGSAELRQRFMARFKEPDLRATLLQRIVMGNLVFDHEEVVRNFPEGRGRMNLVMIYEVQNGRIAKAWMLSGDRKLD